MLQLRNQEFSPTAAWNGAYTATTAMLYYLNKAKNSKFVEKNIIYILLNIEIGRNPCKYNDFFNGVGNTVIE